MAYEAVIGLEIHVQLNAATKLFCDCPNRPGDDPNRNICPVCLWLPGVAPQLSRAALEKGVLASLALNCTIQPESAFDQKVYYYPDLPKGYQLSQHHQPLARDGWVEIIDADNQLKRLRIHHIHLEEDVAKLVHETDGRTPISLVDFNRAGTPLIEIVSEPDMRTPHDAMAYVKTLRAQLRYTGCAECSLEQGTLRVDANISVRPRGSDQLNTKVEVKNMNSIRNVGDAIAYEIERQSACMEKGTPVTLHTRLWDPDKRVTVPMRAKFEGPCIPDPSVARIVIDAPWLAEIKQRLPEMPAQKIARFIKDFGLPPDEAAAMTAEREWAALFEATADHGLPPRKVANWISTRLMPMLRERRQSLQETRLSADRFAALLDLLEQGTINAQAAKEVLPQLLDSDDPPQTIVARGGFAQVSAGDELEALVEHVIAQHPADVQDFRNGNAKVLGFLMGQAMKASGGKANPKRLKEVLGTKLASA